DWQNDRSSLQRSRREISQRTRLDGARASSRARKSASVNWSRCARFLGSTRASRGDFGALAEIPLRGSKHKTKFAMAKAPSPARQGACAPLLLNQQHAMPVGIADESGF